MTPFKTVVMWFRRDLRLNDNLALEAASQQNAHIVPVFCFDPMILASDSTHSPRLAFLLAGLRALDEALRQRSSRLLILKGKPVEALANLVDQLDASAVFFNRDYTPFARKRDTEITEGLRVPVYGYDDALLHAPGEVLKDDGKPYMVYTPFKRQWLALLRRVSADDYLDTAQFFAPPDDIGKSIPTLADLGFQETFALPQAGEIAAQQHLDQFMAGNIFHYGEARNRLVTEPWRDTKPGSSYLSPYFRIGMLSPRQAYWAARDAYQQAANKPAKESVETFVSELIWREFYMHIMYFFPHVAGGNFRPEYDAVEWDTNPTALQAWKDGMTGYPVVDAAMRQLQAQGWMPNRARMIVASFLTKDLLINWREGERHFMRWLIDGDPAANNGGWQWAAGTGTDAQPYFRIFNPISQSQKFDPTGEYLYYWLPELADVAPKHIHAPWLAPNPPKAYPPPIVDHKKARERTLAAYKAVKS